MQNGGWSQQRALKCATILDPLPAVDRRRIALIVVDSEAPPPESEKMIESFSIANPEIRKRAYDWFRSKDRREHEYSMTYLAKTSPIPDSRAVYLGTVAKRLKEHAASFKGDSFNDRIASLGSRASALAHDQFPLLSRLENVFGKISAT